jgi:DNA (cytosine-5)-methyltransferase 1
VSRPRLLDLFCGAGGCAVGYHRAGFDVVGVDIHPQPNYPFTFVQADALSWLGAQILAYQYDGCGFHYHAIHASPPCQSYSVSRHIHNSGTNHPDLLARTRELLQWAGVPWVIENVGGAPLRMPAMLCGLMFGLQVLRHRYFESSHLLLAPSHPQHPKGNLTNSMAGYSTGAQGYVCVAGHNFNRIAGARAMGVEWMRTRREVAQAIPPAYTEFIGRQLMQVVNGGAK